MDFWHSLGGRITVSVTSADIPNVIQYLQKEQITLYHVKQTDDPLTLLLSIDRKDMQKFRYIANKKQLSWETATQNGLYWAIKKLKKRPILLVAMLLFITLIGVLPTRVLFFRVIGNASVPTNLILEKSSQCGLHFGASRSAVRSEKVKNALLEAIPQLQWVGVNTSGCVATIYVRERSEQPSIAKPTGISSIVAARDGVVVKITSTRGNQVCSVGQVVREGQILISGYTDCGITLRGEVAEGEVYALTKRQLSVIYPSEHVQKANQIGETKKYSLILGKKRINFYKDSGISPDSCVKMYSEKYLTLPGGFTLPIAVATEKWTYYETQKVFADELTAKQFLTDYSKQYLLSQMVAGECITQTNTIGKEKDRYVLSGNYSCSEMIGILQNEELVQPNE